jgi:hypothetical protein
MMSFFFLSQNVFHHLLLTPTRSTLLPISSFFFKFLSFKFPSSSTSTSSFYFFSSGGLWVPKRFAALKKGDIKRYEAVNKSLARYVEGSVELRSLRQLFKLSFNNCRIISMYKDKESDDEAEGKFE